MLSFPTDVRDPDFVKKVNWYGYQNAQATANQKVHDEYVTYSQAYLEAQRHNAELGLAVEPAKPVPVQTIYNDDFTISHPPFPDLTQPVVNPADFKPTTGPGFGSLNPNGATVESQATLAMLAHLVQIVEAIKAKVGA